MRREGLRASLPLVRICYGAGIAMYVFLRSFLGIYPFTARMYARYVEKNVYFCTV